MAADQFPGEAERVRIFESLDRLMRVPTAFASVDPAASPMPSMVSIAARSNREGK